MANLSIQPVNGFLAVFTPWNPAFLSEFKATVPASARRFDSKTKAWLIEPGFQNAVLPLIAKHYQQDLQPVSDLFLTAEPVTRKVRLEYLGQCKERADGSVSATGWADGGWTIVIPEAVLRNFFAGDKSEGAETLYSLLGVQERASLDEIKSGHRRAARQWHPDHCTEPDAAERFRAIQTAWEILRDPLTRKKYDAGLYFERSLTSQCLRHSRWENYVSPYRCGVLNVTGVYKLNLLHVEQIHDWKEIVNPDGAVMISSWSKGADHFTVNWVI